MTAPHLGPGQVVAGKYTVRSLLAFQSATATYHATDAQGGQVALKLLDPAIGQRADVMGELDQVAAESKVLAGHRVHPVLDSGYDPATSAPFRVTEFLTIPSLARLVENGPLSEEVVRAIVGGLALPLDTGHGRGLFHHALKPTNVFVGPAPQYPVVVTDYGARAIRSAVPTREAYIEAAPWWAPEQMHPSAQLGIATDVYSVALLAFYGLTGLSYWRSCQSSPPDVEAWQQEAMGAHVRASARAQELGRPLNGALDGVFERALSVQPADRPQTIDQLAQWLGHGGGASAAAAPSVPASAPVASPAAVVASAPQMAAAQPALPAQPAQPQAQPSGAQALAAVSGAQAAAVQSMPQASASSPQIVTQQPSVVVAQHVAAPQAVAAQAELHPGTPGLPAFPEPAPKRRRTGALPIVIGIIVALLLGGGAVGYLFFFRGPDGPADGQASAEPVATGDSAPAGSGSADPSASSGEGSEDAGAGDGDGGDAQRVSVKIICVPGCDKIVVDGDKIDKHDEPLELLPGKHTVEVSKAGYVPRKATITVELGTPLEKKFVMVRVPTGGGKKPCGKFLKRCD